MPATSGSRAPPGRRAPADLPPGEELFPKFSPDGQDGRLHRPVRQLRSMSSLSRGRPGSSPSATTSGRSRHAAATITRVLGWTRTASRSCSAAAGSPGTAGWDAPFLVPAAGGMETLPVPYGGMGALSPDGNRMVYAPIMREFRTWRRHKGGRASTTSMVFPNPRDPDLRARLVRRLPLLADVAQHARVRGGLCTSCPRRTRASAWHTSTRPSPSRSTRLQDVGTLEGTQMGLEQRAFATFPLNDQEILVRHFHKTVGDWVDAYARERAEEREADELDAAATEFAELERYAATWCLPTEPERWARAAAQLDGRSAARSTTPASRVRRRRSRTATGSRSTSCPPTSNACCSSCTRC